MEPAEIRALRKKLRLTEAALAKQLDVEPSLVFAWERGERFPTKVHSDALRKLAEAPSLPPATVPIDALLAQVLASPEFYAALRKIAAHAELRAAVLKLAASYADPEEPRG